MRFKCITPNQATFCGIFMLEDYLKKKDLNMYLNLLKDYTKKDEMKNNTNVKATMTTYDRLLENNNFRDLMADVIDTMDFIFHCKNNYSNSFAYELVDCWGMKHVNEDHTINHTHFPYSFSGSLYLDVPMDDVFITFPIMNQKIKLRSNMLLLFPGVFDHHVNPSNSKKPRYSLAFNAYMRNLPDKNNIEKNN